MPRSRSPSPSLSHFFAIEVVRIGQSALLSIQSDSSSLSADCRRYRCLVSRTSRSLDPEIALCGLMRSVGSSCLVQFSHWSPRALS